MITFETVDRADGVPYTRVHRGASCIGIMAWDKRRTRMFPNGAWLGVSRGISFSGPTRESVAEMMARFTPA